MDIVKFAQENWAVIAQAPWVFVATVVLIGAGGLLFGRYWKGEVVSNLESRLAPRADRIADYERKLDGASPEEAKAKIAALEARVQTLEHDPRLFTQETLAKMVAELKQHKPGNIAVTRDNSSTQSVGVQRQIRHLFRDHGWSVQGGTTLDDFPSLHGLTIITHTGDVVSSSETALREALDAAGIKYEVLRQQIGAEEAPQLIFNDLD